VGAAQPGLGHRQQYAEAVNLFAAAFAEDPSREVGDARYNAACYAARVGTEASKLGAAERGRWRERALGWLRDELEANSRSLRQTPETCLKVARRLAFAADDADRAGVREPERLTRLPAAAAARGATTGTTSRS
jgi:hypothetical protein